MTSQGRALLLSLRPRFAELVVSGVKTVELRRVRPKAAPGTPVLVYATSPRRELIGCCEVAAVVSATPDEIWALHSNAVGLCRNEYDEYFDGASTATAIRLVHAMRLDAPIPLDRLREVWNGFHPPQSFRYVPGSDVAAVVSGHRYTAAVDIA